MLPPQTLPFPKLPFYQGQLDNYCALYAMLNAISSVTPLAPHKGKKLFSEALINISQNKQLFVDVANNTIDFTDIVKNTFLLWQPSFSEISYYQPFLEHPAHTATTASNNNDDLLWAKFYDWLNKAKQKEAACHRSILFRFHSYPHLRIKKPGTVHWTAAYTMETPEKMHLRDSSMEATAIKTLHRNITTFNLGTLSTAITLLIEPHTIFFIEKKISA